jgi:histone-lysine N-methyltransferase SUV39H
MGTSSQAQAKLGKRKSPDGGLEIERRSSPFDRRLHKENCTTSISRSSSVSSTTPSTSADINVYNGVLDADENGFIFCHSASIT